MFSLGKETGDEKESETWYQMHRVFQSCWRIMEMIGIGARVWCDCDVSVTWVLRRLQNITIPQPPHLAINIYENISFIHKWQTVFQISDWIFTLLSFHWVCDLIKAKLIYLQEFGIIHGFKLSNSIPNFNKFEVSSNHKQQNLNLCFHPKFNNQLSFAPLWGTKVKFAQHWPSHKSTPASMLRFGEEQELYVRQIFKERDLWTWQSCSILKLVWIDYKIIVLFWVWWKIGQQIKSTPCFC